MTKGKTINCVLCFAPNPSFMGGHVHKRTKKIFATVCKDCKSQVKVVDSCKGCYGEWTDEMGYEPYQISVGCIEVPILKKD